MPEDGVSNEKMISNTSVADRPGLLSCSVQSLHRWIIWVDIYGVAHCVISCYLDGWKKCNFTSYTRLLCFLTRKSIRTVYSGLGVKHNVIKMPEDGDNAIILWRRGELEMRIEYITTPTDVERLTRSSENNSTISTRLTDYYNSSSIHYLIWYNHMATVRLLFVCEV